MYVLRIDYRRYLSDPTDRTRTPFTLITAVRAAYGCVNAHVERLDGTPVVLHAGRAFSPLTHAPTGRVLHRRSRRYPVPAS